MSYNPRSATDARYVQGTALDASVLYEPTTRLPRGPQPSAVLTEFQPSHGFTASGGTYTANDASDFVRGTQSVKLVTPGDNSTYAVTGGVTSADSTGKIPRVTAKVDNPANLNSLIVDLCTDGTWANGWSWTMQGTTGGSLFFTAGDWVTQSLSFHDATKIGSGSRTGLAAVRFRVRDIGGGAGSAVTVHLQGVELIADGTATFPNGVISITFDDSYQDALDLGKTELDKFGYPATVFTIADRIGLSGRLTLAELIRLQDVNGWELGSHAYADAIHGLTFTGVTAAQLDADARAMKAFAVANGFRAADILAYPKGQYGLTTDSQSTTAILRKYFATGLTTINKTHETYPPSDPMRMRRISSISSFAGAYQPSSLTTATTGDLDLCKANGSWLILTFHEIVTSGVASATQILQSDFAAIIDAINAKGIAVMPVGEVLRYASVAAVAGAAVDLVDVPKPAGAAGSAGVGVLAAPWDHVHPRTDRQPQDHGYLTWSHRPTECNSSGTAPTGGQLQLIRVHLPVAATVTNVGLFVQSVTSVSLTSGQCFAALYNSAGTLLASTADQSVAWTSTGTKVMALATPQACAAGDYYIAFYAVGSVLPTFAKASASFSILNTGLAAASSWYATGAGSLTTAMPGSAGTLAGSSNGFWGFLS